MTDRSDESYTNENPFKLHYLTEEVKGYDNISQFETPNVITESATVRTEYLAGNKDEISLTNNIFFRRHRELNERERLKPHQVELIKEWLYIRNNIVRPIMAELKRKKPSTPLAPISASLRDVPPTMENTLKIIKYLGNLLNVPWRVGYTVLQHEGGITFFKHSDGVIQTTNIARKATIPLISRQIKISLLGLDSANLMPDNSLDTELHKQFGRQLAIQIAVGLQELKENLGKFNGYVALAYVAYNGGAGRAYQIITRGKTKSRPSGIDSKQWEEMCRAGASLLHQMPNEVLIKEVKWACDANMPGWYRLIMIYDKNSSIRLWSYQYLRSVGYSIRKQKPFAKCNWNIHRKIEGGSGEVVSETSREGALDKLYNPQKLGRYFEVAPQDLPSIAEDPLPLKAIDNQIYKVKQDGDRLPA